MKALADADSTRCNASATQAMPAKAILTLLACLAYVRANDLRDLLVATARGAAVLKGHLRSRPPAKLLSQKDEFGFSVLAVAAYTGDYLAAELLIQEGAVLPPGDITAFMGDAPVKLGSIVELAVRRSSMLIMLGTGSLLAWRLS